MPYEDFEELERLDRERPKPPPVLFKYVISDRVDVLENALIRFTPPLNTNDIFEVRQTFDLMMGPKMQRYFKEVSKAVNFDEQLSNALKESGLGFLSVEQAKALFSTVVGGDAETVVRAHLGRFIDQMPTQMNTPESIGRILEKVSSNQMLLSLSERADSSPMWAHYAANSSGFVIAFDTASEFFRRGDQGERQGLHKVQYFSGRLKEMIEDPYAALISKQVDWAYEREWRLYVKPDQVTRVIEQSEEKIELMSFPQSAVQRVILGIRTTASDTARIRAALARYPGVSLTRMRADRLTATLKEETEPAGKPTDEPAAQVGQQFSVTRERIRQIEAKALRKLKHPSRSRKMRSFLDQ